MKKKLTTCALLLWSLHAFGQLQGDSWTNAQKNKEATIIVMYYQTPRFVTKNPEGKLEGICVDIFREFVSYVKKTKGINLKVNIQKPITDFGLFLSTIKIAKGGVFALGPFTITEERKKEMSFTLPYIKNKSILLTNAAAPDLTTLGNISNIFVGMKAYVLKNSTQELEILQLKEQYFPTLEIQYVNNPEDLMNKTLSDTKSFTKNDFLYYADALQNGKSIKRHPAGETTTNPYGFIMPKGSDWALVWGEFLNEKDGFLTKTEYRKILEKHLGFTATQILIK